MDRNRWSEFSDDELVVLREAVSFLISSAMTDSDAVLGQTALSAVDDYPKQLMMLWRELRTEMYERPPRGDSR